MNEIWVREEVLNKLLLINELTARISQLEKEAGRSTLKEVPVHIENAKQMRRKERAEYWKMLTPTSRLVTGAGYDLFYKEQPAELPQTLPAGVTSQGGKHMATGELRLIEQSSYPAYEGKWTEGTPAPLCYAFGIDWTKVPLGEVAPAAWLDSPDMFRLVPNCSDYAYLHQQALNLKSKLLSKFESELAVCTDACTLALLSDGFRKLAGEL